MILYNRLKHPIAITTNKLTPVRHHLFNKKVGSFFICLAIASLLWIVHALNGNYNYILSVPVKFLNLPSDKLIVGDLPDKLDVTIKTSGLKLFIISLKGIEKEIVIDFNSLKTNAKSQAYSISNGNFNLKRIINYDVEIIKIRPDTLFFSLNKGNYSKLVPVKANIKITCLPNYSLISKPTVTPTYISITGDSSDLRLIDTVYTQQLKLKNIYQNFTSTILLKKIASNINYNIKEVLVNGKVDKLTEATMRVPVQIMNKATEEIIKILPEFITVKYLVAMNDYNAIDATSFKASVDYTQIKAKEKTLHVELSRSPSEVKVLQIEPPTVSYLIYK